MAHNSGATREALQSKSGPHVATLVAEPRTVASMRALAFPSRGGNAAFPWFKSWPDLEFRTAELEPVGQEVAAATSATR